MMNLKIFEQDIQKVDSFVNKWILSCDPGGGWNNVALGQLVRDDNGHISIQNPHLLRLRTTAGHEHYLESNLTLNERGEYVLTGNTQATPLYSNYKDLPSRVNLLTELQPDDPAPQHPGAASLTRREALTVSLQRLLEAALHNNKELKELIRKDQVIIYTGHPSSDMWSKPAIVSNFLGLVDDAARRAVNRVAPGHGCKVMTFSESRAAVFYARSKNHDITSQTTILVVDIGASTVDLTLIMPRKMIQRDASITLGGRDLDAALQAIALANFSLGTDDLEMGYQGTLSFQFRIAKEKLYKGGLMNKDAVTSILLPLCAARYGQEACRTVQIDSAMMNKACGDIHVSGTFMNRLFSFVQDFLKNVAKEGDASLDKVIVTGGTGNVTQAREAVLSAVQSVFHGFQKKDMIALIGMDDTNSAVAVGGLHLMAANLQVFQEIDRLEQRLNQVLFQEGMLSPVFAKHLANAIQQDFMPTLYHAVHKPWAEIPVANDLTSLKALNERCTAELNQQSDGYTAKMKTCIAKAIRSDFQDEQGFFSNFADFFSALGIAKTGGQCQLIQEKVKPLLQECADDMQGTMTDRIKECNQRLSLDIDIIQDYKLRIILKQVLKGMANTVINGTARLFGSDRDQITQPREQSTRKLLCDYEHDGQGLMAYIAQVFQKEIDGVVKDFLLKDNHGKALKGKIMEAVQPLLRNAIFLARTEEADQRKEEP